MPTNNRIAFITGVTGQDGAYLASRLVHNGWSVFGGFRRGSSTKTWRLEQLDVLNKIELVEFQLNELQNIINTFQSIRPTHIYNLAGESFVADSFKYPSVAMQVNTLGALNILDAARLVLPDSKYFFASTSEIFGRSNRNRLCDESTSCVPSNPYGISKLASQNFVKLYRESYGLFACSGILFNHESPLRGRQYVTRKISYNLARLKVNGGSPIRIGNMNSCRDWGAAYDYVEAMRLMLDLHQPKDMVIASGVSTSVREFLRMAAQAAGFDPVFEGTGISETCTDRTTGLRLVEVSPKYFRPFDSVANIGSTSLLEQETTWKRTISLKQLVEEMVISDIRYWKSIASHDSATPEQA